MKWHPISSDYHRIHRCFWKMHHLTLSAVRYSRMFYDFLLNGAEVTVVTSDFHIERSTAVFTRIFGLHPSLDLKFLEFIPSESDLNSSERLIHEKNALKDFNQKSSQWLNFDAAKLWLFSHHDNYVNFKSSPKFAEKKLLRWGTK